MNIAIDFGFVTFFCSSRLARNIIGFAWLALMVICFVAAAFEYDRVMKKYEAVEKGYAIRYGVFYVIFYSVPGFPDELRIELRSRARKRHFSYIFLFFSFLLFMYAARNQCFKLWGIKQ
jgi:hypothetical protein